MGSCTRRHFLLSTCFLQMITIIERQVFDFLGYMWLPILVNFFHMLFIIFGFYGAYHFRIKYIITYLLWNFIWIGWNAFLICFYLNVGELDRNSDLLNLGTGSVSWFEVNGYGCKPTYPTNITADDPFRPIRPERVDDCLLDYTLVEIIHSGVQCALALLGILGAILISYIFLDEDDRFDFMNGDAKSPQHTVVHPMYVSYTSIPTSASATMQSNKHQQHLHHQEQQQQQLQLQQQQQTNSLLYHHTLNNHHQNLHQHHNQQQANNNNTFLLTTTTTNTHSNSNSKSKLNQIGNTSSNSNSNSNSNNNNSISNKRRNSRSNSSSNNSHSNNTLTRMLYSPKNNRIAAATSTTSISPLAATPMGEQHNPYYDDSTAKADQLYTNSNNRRQNQQQILPSAATYQQQQQHQQQVAITPTSSHDNTTSSLSYASLQNSNLYLGSVVGIHAASGVGGAGGGLNGSLSNSNYSIANSINNNTHNSLNPSGSGSGHFARIHHKPKTPKSTSYSSFINNSGNAGAAGSNGSSGNLLHHPRPDIKYTQLSSERLSRNLEEEDDNFSLQNFKGDNGVTYVPFQSPTPTSLFVSKNNNPSYTSLNSYQGNNTTNNSNSNCTSINNNSNSSPHNNNNNVVHAPFSILLEHGAILQPIETTHTQSSLPPPPTPPPPSSIMNQAERFIYQQQNGGLSMAAAAAAGYSPKPYRVQRKPPRPTNIPLPTVPVHNFDTPISPSEVTPPPPPAPRPHIFQPRSGHAPYPDLSPEVTEKYAMPTQYVPRSPVASRIARRQRQQQQQQQHHHHQQQHQQDRTSSANFCDQIRDAPPGYIDNGYSIVRAHSHDRLQHSARAQQQQSQQQQQQQQQQHRDANAAPHVNRRSGRRDGRVRPRSYCNSMAGGEGIIRANIASDRAEAVNGVRHVNKKSKHRQSLYSIEFGPSIDTIRSRSSGGGLHDYDDDHMHDRDGGELSPKPMTPRRVKRRSVMARGSNSRQSTTSRRSHHTGTGSRSHKGVSSSSMGGGGGGGGDSSSGTYVRSSMRTSRRKYQQNPVTKLLDQQQQQLQQHHYSHQQHKPPMGSFHHKKDIPTLTATNLQTLNHDIISSSNNIIASAGGGVGSLTKTNNNHYHSFRKNIPPDPIYYNTNGQAGLYQQAWQAHSQSPIVPATAVDEPNSPTLTLTPTLTGHYNPTYQHSTTNLNDAVEHHDDLYNNRPPSVRSSYSNFHGTRPLSSAYMPNTMTENVFAGLTGNNDSLPPPPPPCTPPLYQQHPLHQQQQQQQEQQQPQHQQSTYHQHQQHQPTYQQQQQQQHHQSHHQQQLHSSHSMSQQHLPSPLPPPLPVPMPLPQPLPSPNFSNSPSQNVSFAKRTASRESIRSMAFLNNGPPAYNLNYHTPPDSETTM